MDFLLALLAGALAAPAEVLAQGEGARCMHSRLGVPGTCRYLEDCPSAVAELKGSERANPQICGFRPSALVPNVCCPDRAGGRLQVGAIARRRCQEYAATVLEKDQCHLGKNNGPTIQGLVVNGVPAEPKEFPHMALLGYGRGSDLEFSCAGSLIAPQWVLTAAHCLSHHSKGLVTTVLLGDLDRSTDEDDARPQRVGVAGTELYPEFNASLRYHDIALLRLERPAVLSEYVRPACLHTADPADVPVDAGARVVVSGWGVTDFGDDALSPKLLKARLNVASKAECDMSFGPAARAPSNRLPQGIKDTQLCAGSSAGKDACQGDSGGPLQVLTPQTCMQHVVGVVSLGIFCGSKVPGVYTRVSAYTAWIERTIWPDANASPPSRLA